MHSSLFTLKNKKLLSLIFFIQLLCAVAIITIHTRTTSNLQANGMLSEETKNDDWGIFPVSAWEGYEWDATNAAQVGITKPMFSRTRHIHDKIHNATEKGIKLLPPSQGVYHAAFAEFAPQENVVTGERVERFRALINKDIVWGYFSNNWFDGIVYPLQQIETLHAYGITPFVRLMPRSRFQVGGEDPVYTLQKIIDGTFDEEIRRWAKEAARSGIPLLIEFGTEMNGDWFTWSGVSNGGSVTTLFGDPTFPDGPERFQVAYRHIIDLFRSEGAHNVTWFFHVNLSSWPEDSWNQPEMYYPGDDYIDWVGVSVYGAQQKDDPWVLFSEQMDKYFGLIQTIAPSKPIAILEFGVVERPGKSKADWIEDALLSIQSGRYENVYAISYWHSKWTNNDGFVSNMRLNSSRAPLLRYRSIIQDPYFVTTPIFSK